MSIEENKIYIDLKINNSIRTYKEFDNILYTIGIDNIILGLIKINTISSEKEEANKILDEKYLKKIKDIIPLGSYINGCLLIYNENTFEDFESVLSEQLEKIKELNKDLIINKPDIDIKYIQLALKELLYLDDEDDFNFEVKKLGDDNDDVDIVFEDNLSHKLFMGNDAKYKFLISKINILFNNKNSDEIGNVIEMKKDQLKDIKYLDDIFEVQNNKGIMVEFTEQKLTIKENFEDENIFDKLKIENINESNPNINQLYYSNIKLGLQKKDNSNQFIENIKITDLELKEELKSNFYIEIIAIITPESKNNEKLFISMLSQIKTSIQNLFSEDNKNLYQKVVIYSNLYHSLPFNLITQTPISFSDDKYISISDDINTKTKILDEINITKIFNINGVSFFDFCPTKVKDIREPNKSDTEHILNPHLKIPNILEQPKDTHIIRALVRGDYHYYHYNQDNFKDAGWGCAYRSLQTLISWFKLNTSVGKNIKIPSIPEIQTILVKLGDKDKKIIGSNEWIGAIEVNLVLNDLLGIDNQILYVSNGPELNSKGRELLYHFQHSGTPVMVGGGVYAYTILGVDYDKVKGECKFLILDPHYVGDDDIKTIINKGWCNWKGIDIFKKENFYNLCLPLAN